MATFEKILIVIRKTRLDEVVARFNTRAQAKFYIDHSGGDFDRYAEEHETYYRALTSLKKEVRRLAKMQVVERSHLPNFIFTPQDLVVTIGIDGLVVNTAKYLTGQPIVAVNPDPANIEGVLLPFTVDQAPQAIQTTLTGSFKVKEITMAEVRLNDGARLVAFNDLFIGVQSHVSARYRIQMGTRVEQHSSSGIIVSTGAGATGWLSSLFNMAEGIQSALSESPAPLNRPLLAWDTDRLIFVVREPFASRSSGAAIVCGEIQASEPLLVESHNPSGGVIFSDGVLSDFLPFNAGAHARIGLAEEKTRLVVP